LVDSLRDWLSASFSYRSRVDTTISPRSRWLVTDLGAAEPTGPTAQLEHLEQQVKALAADQQVKASNPLMWSPLFGDQK
jgi:long-subunit fatty acid transport protein